MAPAVVNERNEEQRAPLSGTSLAGNTHVRRFAGACEAGLSTVLHTGRKWAAARATPWLALAAATALSMLPLRFEAESRLMFEVGAQPPAAIVNGMAQLIGSRELAQEAIRRLSAEDVSRLASNALVPLFPTSAPSDADEAARNLRTSLSATPTQGGRGLDITVQAPSPALAQRVADAYINAVLELDSTIRAQASAQHHLPLPTMRRETMASSSWMPELPSPLILLLLAFGGGALAFARHRRARMEPVVHGFVDPDDLPREVNTPRRVIWVDNGAGEGVPLDAAVARIETRLPATEGAQTMGSLSLFTAHGDVHEAGHCALQFARQRAESADVVMVFVEDVPSLAEVIALPPCNEGLHDVLAEQADFTQVIHRDVKSRAHVIRAGLPQSMPLSAGQERRLCTLLDVLRQAYEHVVVFMPEIGDIPAPMQALNPVTLCVLGAQMPAISAVEQCEALTARHLSPVVIVRLATESEEESPVMDGLPLPSLDVISGGRPGLPALVTHYGPGWPYPDLVRAA